MANVVIPITLTWGTSTQDLSNLDLNALGTEIAARLAASIIANASFYVEVVNDPATKVTNVILNLTQRLFKEWSDTEGKYVAITQFTVGDVKNSFIGTDDISNGWVILDGRLISAITGISGAQQQALESIFGAGGSIPTVTPANINGLPANGSFSGIVWPPSINPVVTPAAGVISPGLTFSNPVADTEAQAFADQVEILRDSAQTAFDVTKEIQAQAEYLLNALNQNTTPPLYALIFAGYP